MGIFAQTTAVIRTATSEQNDDGVAVQDGAVAHIVDSLFAYNGTGVEADSNGMIRLSNSAVVNNVTGVQFNGNGNIFTRAMGNPAYAVKSNTVQGNSTNGLFSGTFPAQ